MLNVYQMKQLNLHNYIIYLMLKKYESIYRFILNIFDDINIIILY